MELLGYIATILIGVSLGLIGGGGSILMVPLLVYVFKMEPVAATSYSLFIVGLTSITGAIQNYSRGWVNTRVALQFGISSVLIVFITRKWILPAIPEQLGTIGDVIITKALLMMVLFAILMVGASISMIINGSREPGLATAAQGDPAILKLSLYGAGIGLVTGLLGAGGGFLLIPAMVLLLRMPMKEAVGTSLLIIAINSVVGFAGDIGSIPLDWGMLLILGAISVAGILAGTWLGKSIPGYKLKKGFGWFVLVLGLVILYKEFSPLL